MLDVNLSVEKRAFKLSVRYSFQPGITGIWGESGAGKSTLLNAIAGFETLLQSELMLNQQSIVHLP